MRALNFKVNKGALLFIAGATATVVGTALLDALMWKQAETEGVEAHGEYYASSMMRKDGKFQAVTEYPDTWVPEHLK